MVATFSSDWPTMSDAFQNGDCKKLGFIKIFDEVYTALFRKVGEGTTLKPKPKLYRTYIYIHIYTHTYM